MLGILVATFAPCLATEPPSTSSGLDDKTLFAFAPDRLDLNFSDIITLKTGVKHCGKVMEWADKVILFQNDGRPQVFDAAGVSQFEFRRFARHGVRPDAPDLTVAYIERLPRDPSWHGYVSIKDGLPVLDVDPAQIGSPLKAGTRVTFKVHILNAGIKPSQETSCQVFVDDQKIHDAELPALNPGTRHALECAWTSQADARRLRVRIDPPGTSNDSPRWNNDFQESLHAVPLAMVVDRAEYARFAQTMNLVDTYCFEDWMQYQIRVLNALFSESRYPSAPEGINERVRLDRLIITEDPMDEQIRAGWANSLREKGQADGRPEYGTLLVMQDSGTEAWSTFRPLKVDWRMLHQVCRQLGLIDLTRTDTRVEQCLARDQFERYVQREHLFPNHQTMMYQPGPFRFTEVCAAFLNHTIGRPRGLSGDYLYQVPANVEIEVRGCDGRPIEGVRVDAYQLQAEGELAGYVAGPGPRDPLYSTATGPEGRCDLINQDCPAHTTPMGYELRPNIFGKISTDGSNGLLLLRLTLGRAEEYHFVRLFDCNLAYLRGDRDRHRIELRTLFGQTDAPLPPPTTAIFMEDRSVPLPQMVATWFMPPGQDFKRIEEFRVYAKTSLAGESAAPFTLAAAIRRINRRWVMRYDGDYFDPAARPRDGYSLDTFLTVASVDRDGRQGSFGPPAYLAYDKYALKFAIAQDSAYITLGGPGPMQMLRWDGDIGTHPYGVRSVGYPGYRAHNAGIAVTTDHRLVCTDPVNHVIGFYSLRGDLEQLSPRRDIWPGYASDEPGEFFDPVDLAVDDRGQIYVADRGNNRVQILDSQGGYVGLLDEQFRFKQPHAVGFANGHLCVTDRNGSRIRVYNVSGESPELVRELTDLVDADRGLISPMGRLYTTGKDRYSDRHAVLIWAKDNDVQPEQIVMDVEMGRVFAPRGMYLYKLSDAEQYAYFVNKFPFDVRRLKLDAIEGQAQPSN